MNNYPRWKNEMTDQLFMAILTLENKDECYRFFEDIATINEIKELSQRLEVARMLSEGFIYEDIVQKTGASSATISRVKKCLNYGADGYQIVLKKLKKKKINIK
ncbi:MAG: YerC/YecD family TrpR-related protein [Candidatus Caldatribacteriota bacterium]|jgi:TrpR-related protein YerC/YecD|nr:YerC/YecD family TrpR-related protein [Atribacterota bacterium]MDD4289026.1 YerC/YecD family TrpR-related protein [Atribacterota bacterium]MDI9597845.1 YerC/YecD family TrpR-related protein [Atribacterota bacterium]